MNALDRFTRWLFGFPRYRSYLKIGREEAWGARHTKERVLFRDGPLAGQWREVAVGCRGYTVPVEGADDIAYRCGAISGRTYGAVNYLRSTDGSFYLEKLPNPGMRPC